MRVIHVYYVFCGVFFIYLCKKYGKMIKNK